MNINFDSRLKLVINCISIPSLYFVPFFLQEDSSAGQLRSLWWVIFIFPQLPNAFGGGCIYLKRIKKKYT